MTFAELFTEVSANVWPEGRSARLASLHKTWLKDVLIDVQRKVKCFQISHLHYVNLSATYFSCGASVFEAPQGAIIKEFWTEDNETRCKKIHALPQSKDSFQCTLESKANCACSDIEDPYQYYAVGDDYYAYPELPLGLKYPDSTVDSDTRSCVRSFALFDGFIWTFPALSSLETGVLRWDGIKKTWQDTDLIQWLDDAGQVDRDLIKACELYLEYKKARKENCDNDDSKTYLAEYNAHIADMIVDCKRSQRMPDGRSCFTACGTSGGTCG